MVSVRTTIVTHFLKKIERDPPAPLFVTFLLFVLGKKIDRSK